VTTHGGPRLLDHHEYKGSAGGFVPEISGKECNDPVTLPSSTPQNTFKRALTLSIDLVKTGWWLSI
jgi:hypothetical protein